MGKIDFIFRKKRIWLALSVFTLMLGSLYVMQSYSFGLKQVAGISSGMQVCFNRVVQSYTAKMLNHKSAVYLESDFLSNTEECFAETIAAVQESSKEIMPYLTKKLNMLAADTHWLNERLFAQNSFALEMSAQDIMANLNSRFEKIEVLKNEISDRLDAEREVLSAHVWVMRFIFFALVVISFGYLFLEFFMSKRAEAKHEELEQAAEKSLFDPITNNPEDVLVEAFNSYELHNCSKLVLHYSHELKKAYDEGVNLNIVQPKNLSPIDKNQESNQFVESCSQVTKVKSGECILEIGERPVLRPKDISSLEEALSKVISLLSGKLFSSGIVIDWSRAEETILINGAMDDLEQLIFNAVNQAVKSCVDSMESGGRIVISTKKLGSTVLIDISDNGVGIDQEFISTRLNLSTNSSKQMLWSTILESITDDLGGKVSFSNIINEKGAISGGKISFVLKAFIDTADIDNSKWPETSLKNEKRLINLKKGSKRDILQGIADSKTML